MKNILFIIIALFQIIHLNAQDECMEIGTNFHYFDAGVFKDLKLSSTPFFTRNQNYVGDDNDWDSGLANTMPQDEAGYPLEIPFNHPTTGEPQIVAFTVGGYNQNYLAGDYVLLYDGTATFYFAEWTGATVTSSTPGRIEFNVGYVDENGIHIEIISSPSSDHVHNIRIMETVHESGYVTDPLYPEFVQKANEFEALRFMDWVHTNHHPVSSWNERTSAQFHTQNVDQKGMSWEQLITISNLMQKDVWVNVPHLADEGYIDGMAQLFRDNLDPNLTIYLEYSNECWNWIFDQTYWLDEAAPFYTYGRNYGHYSRRVFNRWDMAFAGQGHRIKTVLAGHDYFVLDALAVFDDEGDTDLVDLVSYPGYVALDEADYATLNSLGASATASDVMAMLADNMDDQFYWMQQFKELVADSYGKDFVMYEGGQHLTPEWFGLDAPYNQALYDAQVHSEMYDFYQEMFSYYQDELDIKLFMNYVLASPRENPFGSWGLVETYFTEAPYSPKWNAVMDWRDNNTSCITSTENFKPNENTFEVYPNPTSDFIEINMDSPFSITIYNAEGKLFQNGNIEDNTIDVSSFPSGLYWLQLTNEEGVSSSKFIKQ